MFKLGFFWRIKLDNLLLAQALVTFNYEVTIMISQESFIKAWENKKLVAGALKVSNVRRDYVYYEDIMQDGIMLYAELLDKYGKSKPAKEIDKLAFRKIIWKTIDELRKIKKHEERCSELDDAFNLYRNGYDWQNLIILKQEIAKMTQEELLILFEHFLAGKTITQIVAENNIPRIRIKRFKKKLISKMKLALLA